MSDQKTNIEAVTEMMNFSEYGALAQVFIIEAIGKYADQVAKATPEQLASLRDSFFSPEAWQGVAREVREKLNKHLHGTVSENEPSPSQPQP